ncbi:NUDIX domain-containing protein [Halomicrococcus sp. SG-WS-1]|uniref:NUDIX domain-containing protein n=1 Tax=Halomicrococcus sp. SG-WS-1 TaxID=3439057 RepID=UPI003F7A1770
MVSRPADYCPYCGTELTTTDVEGNEHFLCRDCDRVVWHNPVPCASVAVVDDDAVLLVRRAAEPGVGDWTVPGGHLERAEPPAVGAARELEEESGLSVAPDDLSLFDARSLDPHDGKHVVSIGFVVARERTTGSVTAGSDASDARFWTPTAFERADEPFRERQRERFESAPDAL